MKVTDVRHGIRAWIYPEQWDGLRLSRRWMLVEKEVRQLHSYDENLLKLTSNSRSRGHLETCEGLETIDLIQRQNFLRTRPPFWRNVWLNSFPHSS